MIYTQDFAPLLHLKREVSKWDPAILRYSRKLEGTLAGTFILLCGKKLD